MITLNRKPGERYLELGGGANPVLIPAKRGGQDCCVDVRDCADPDGSSTVDFTADFHKPLPIQDEDFHGVFCQFALEHISYLEIPGFLKECFRVTKPGGKAIFVTPNTEAQLRWVLEHPEGWDGKDLFNSASEKLFGTLDYPENSHKAYLNPKIAEKLFQDAGFSSVRTQPYGARATDMVITAVKGNPPTRQGESQGVDARKAAVQKMIDAVKQNPPDSTLFPAPEIPTVILDPVQKYNPADLHDKHYFNGGTKNGGYLGNPGYRDFPANELIARSVLLRRPGSVLEIGAGRGYVTKRLQDAGVHAWCMDVSKHCYMTRACDFFKLWDITRNPDQYPWPFVINEDALDENLYRFGMSLSQNVLQHIPEDLLPNVFKELKRTCKRHLHAIDTADNNDNQDKTLVTRKPLAWWRSQFTKHGLTDFEVVGKDDLWKGDPPQDYLQGDGKVKLNLGSHMVMSYHGWLNLDSADLMQFANQYGHHFMQHDLKKGLPFDTGSVDLIYSSHCLEHFTPKEGLLLLRECRRVIKPDGAIRILVPDVALLMKHYLDPTWISSQDVNLDDFIHINDDVEKAKTPMEKYWVLANSGHQAGYDEITLAELLRQAGFHPLQASFRKAGCKESEQIVKECLESFVCLSLTMDAQPITGE